MHALVAAVLLRAKAPMPKTTEQKLAPIEERTAFAAPLAF
jgi:hypothetical protein